MKIIIEAGKRKRVIEGDYRICGSLEDLNVLQRTLEVALNNNFNYGWIEVRTPMPPSLSDTPPEPWDGGQAK